MDASSDTMFSLTDVLTIDSNGLATVPGKSWTGIRINDDVSYQRPGESDIVT